MRKIVNYLVIIVCLTACQNQENQSYVSLSNEQMKDGEYNSEEALSIAKKLGIMGIWETQNTKSGIGLFEMKILNTYGKVVKGLGTRPYESTINSCEKSSVIAKNDTVRFKTALNGLTVYYLYKGSFYVKFNGHKTEKLHRQDERKTTSN